MLGRRNRNQWTPERIEELRRAYVDGDMSVTLLAELFGTSHTNICRFARELGWPRRFHAGAIANQTAARWARAGA